MQLAIIYKMFHKIFIMFIGKANYILPKLISYNMIHYCFMIYTPTKILLYNSLFDKTDSKSQELSEELFNQH